MESVIQRPKKRCAFEEPKLGDTFTQVNASMQRVQYLHAPPLWTYKSDYFQITLCRVSIGLPNNPGPVDSQINDSTDRTCTTNTILVNSLIIV
jgi:hypothetical protein